MTDPNQPYQPQQPQWQPPQNPGPQQWPVQSPYQGPPQPSAPMLPPGYELKKKKRFYKRVWFWLLMIVIVIVVVIIASVASVADKAVNNPHTVIYKVTGNGKTADVTYTNINGDGTSGSEQAGSAPVPFSKTVNGKGDFSIYSLVAQAKDGTTVSCSITVDGKVKATQTSTGQFSVVTCTADGN